MSKLTDIKYRIDQLDGGHFQNLCDEYLSLKGYGVAYPLGMKTGTDKTTKGIPDTYFLTLNNKYVFAMYTTQKSDFMTKAIKDIRQCFDHDTTGIPSGDVVEIVYCHTYGGITPKNDKILKGICAEHNGKLTLIGLDEIGSDLYFKFPRLAKDFLNVCIDTGQITGIEEFIFNHDSNKMSAPLDTHFLYREEELNNAKTKLEQCDVLVISGAAGIGKTRLALQLCSELSIEKDYQILCIRSNNLELYEDLVSSLGSGKKNIIFIDDANELTGLKYVLDLLGKEDGNRSSIEKIILTVREYARREVVSKILEYIKPEIIKLELFSDENIRGLMESLYGITNELYLEKIISISEGNARLAMLAGKIASESNDLKSIRDASDLYENYYKKQIDIIDSSSSVTISAGIIAFFEFLHLGQLDRIEPVFSFTGITKDQFIIDIHSLHKLEFVDIFHDKAVRISDQSFGNYLLKNVYFDNKIISLSKMIETGLFINQNRVITVCNIINNVFFEKKIIEYLERQVITVWEDLKNDNERFSCFFKIFHMFRPTETLIQIKESIDSHRIYQVDVMCPPFNLYANSKDIKDDIINILCSFKYHQQLPEAVDLLLLYFSKRPDLFEQVYNALVVRWGVDKHSHQYHYITQKIVIEHLCKYVDLSSKTIDMALFICVAAHYLRVNFESTEAGRNHAIIFYRIPLFPQDTVFEYRHILLMKLNEIYRKGCCTKEIEKLFLNYINEKDENLSQEIIIHDLDIVINFIKLLSPDCLYHCLIAEHIYKVTKKVAYIHIDALNMFLNSEKYLIYHTLSNEREDIYVHDYHEREEIRRKSVYDLVKTYDLLKFKCLLDVVKECCAHVDGGEYILESGLKWAIDATVETKELYIEIIKLYLSMNTPCNISPCIIIRNLFSMMLANEVKDLIDNYDFSQKNTWQWYYYVELPDVKVTHEMADELLSFLEIPSQKITKSPNRPIKDILKFERIDQDFFVKASRKIAEYYEESPFVFNLYFSLMLDSINSEVSDVIVLYRKDISLLEDIYLKSAMSQNNTDRDGDLLREICKEDRGFFDRYLNYCVDNRLNEVKDDDWFVRLRFIWNDNEYMAYMNGIFEFYINKLESSSIIPLNRLNIILQDNREQENARMRQEKWIESTIENNCFNSKRIQALFFIISDLNNERRRNFIKKLLMMNKDFCLFDSLPLLPILSSWVGSEIPHIQDRITYLESLLPLVAGLDYLKHKHKIENYIEEMKLQLKNIEIEEILRSL